MQPYFSFAAGPSLGINNPPQFKFSTSPSTHVFTTGKGTAWGSTRRAQPLRGCISSNDNWPLPAMRTVSPLMHGWCQQDTRFANLQLGGLLFTKWCHSSCGPTHAAVAVRLPHALAYLTTHYCGAIWRVGFVMQLLPTLAARVTYVPRLIRSGGASLVPRAIGMRCTSPQRGAHPRTRLQCTCVIFLVCHMHLEDCSGCVRAFWCTPSTAW